MDTQSLTYRELADTLGIKLDSARKTAQRRRWSKSTGNDGLVRILVPTSYLDTPRDSPTDSPRHSPKDNPAFYTHELEIRLDALKALFATETLRANAAERRAELAEANATAWQRQAEAAQAQLTNQRQAAPPQKRRWFSWSRSAA